MSLLQCSHHRLKHPLPSMISSKQYRSLLWNKTKNVKRRKSASDEWICAYCQRLWSEDNSCHVRSVWVKCDKFYIISFILTLQTLKKQNCVVSRALAIKVQHSN